MDKGLERYIKIAEAKVNDLHLDLSGLHVITECASKAYGFMPVIAAMAGARVSAIGKDSSYGSFEDNRSAIVSILDHVGVTDKVAFFKDSLPAHIYNEADILTNSGFIRPITKDKITQLKRTCVIPLMWEPWELREGEIDIFSCQQNGIPVIGTNEHYKDADMYAYPGMLALKFMLDSGLEVANNNIVLLGGGLTGRLIAKTLLELGLKVSWFGDDVNSESGMRPYTSLPTILENNRVDVILMADHVFNREVLGPSGYLDFPAIFDRFPSIKFCHLCGNIDREALLRSGIAHYPPVIKPFGYMSYETINLGWEPVIVLLAAGLKVGEIGARARLAGNSIGTTIKMVVDHGIGMDFEGGFMNLKPTH